MNQLKQKADRTISTAIRARVPVLAVETPEEGRVLDLMVSIGLNPRFPDKRKKGDLTRPVFVWSIAHGIVHLATEGGIAANLKNDQNNDELKDPIAAMRWMLEWGDKRKDAPALFIITDVQPYLESAQFVRLIREANMALTPRKQNIILLAPIIELPADLVQDITLITYPLPTVEELRELIDIKAKATADQGIKVKMNGDSNDVASALAGLTWHKCEEAIRIAIVRTGAFVADQVIPIMLAEKTRIINASPALEYFHNKEAWDDIGGFDLLKPYAARAIRSQEPAAKAYGVDRRRGILLVGLPGCGKSLLAKALAGSRLPLIRLDIGALFGGLMGQSEQQCRQALEVISALGRCILWIDEIEKALATGGGEGDSGTSRRVLATILTWMEETTADVYVVATANDITQLRPELVRRFDTTWFVDLPDESAREEILHIHLRKRNRDADALGLDIPALVDLTNDFTGAEIEQTITEAIAQAYDEGAVDIEQSHLVNAAKSTMPLIHTMEFEMNEMRKWASRARAASSRQQVGQGAKGGLDAIEL